MVSSTLKKRFEETISVGIRHLSVAGLTPNAVTTLGLLVALSSAWCYYSWRTSILLLPTAGILILLSGLLDAVDGVLARTTGQVTAFGGFFDSVADRYADAFTLSGVILGGLCDPLVGLLALIGSFMVSYTRSRSEAAGVEMAGVGLAERAERMLILSTVTFIAIYWVEALNYGVIILAVISHLTVIQRTLYFQRKTI